MKSIFVVIMSSFLMSCATPNDPNYDPSSCSYDGGRARGYNDARAQKRMDLKFVQYCGFKKEDTRAGYTEGYEDFNKNKGNETAGSTSNQSESININIGGVQSIFGGGSGSSGSGSQNPQQYFCKVRAFSREYEAFGPTRLEARKKVMDACKQKHHPMHCDDPSCRENR